MPFSSFKCAFFEFFQLKVVSVCLFTGLLFMSVSAVQGAGELDPTFGSGGKVFTPFDGLNADYQSRTALQADGKIVMSCRVLAGFFNRRICLVRYNADGSLDTSFGAGGKVITDLPRAEDYANAVAIQADGKIVVAGSTADVGSKLTFYDLAVLRYNSDGSADTSFGIGGVKILDFGVFEFFSDMVIQPDGKIVAAGRIGAGAGVVRLNTDGSPDASFDGDGAAITLFPEFQSYVVNNVALAPNGKIVISGTENFKTWFMVRHNADGSLDTSFDQDGKATTAIAPNGARDSDMVVQADGKIIIAGYVQPTFTAQKSDIALARYNTNGSLDTTFDGDGIVIKHPGDPNLNDEVAAAALQPDGKLVVLANLNNVPFSGSPHALWAILRFNTDGSLDTSFNDDGVATATATGTQDIASSLSIQPDGKFLVSGKTGSSSVFALLRFNVPTQSPFDFDGDGKTDVSVYRPSNGSWWLSLSSTNSISVIGFNFNQSFTPVPADYTGDGKTDVALYYPFNSTYYILQSETSTYYFVQIGARDDIPAPGDFDGDGKTDLAVYRPSNGAWIIKRSSDGVVTTQIFGIAEDKPAVADYDGDGKDDIAIFRPSTGAWWLNRSSLGIVAIQFGEAGDKIVQGDYTGDGKAELALWRESNGFWYILRSEDYSFYGFPFGATGDLPVPGDYDGDGKLDAGIYRPSNNFWYLLRSTQGVNILQFGLSSDIKIPNVFVR